MTTSYKAGTVSVSAGSRRVTGISTGWILANISPGYFGLSDGRGSVVPVEAIVSDTELDLFVPWSGPSLSGQEYWLSYDTRDGQQTVNNAQRLAEYVARLDSDALSAISGLEPSANKIIKFTGESAATLIDFGAGAESLLGLTGVADTIPYMTGASTYATTAFGAAARALLAGGIVPEAQLPTRLRGAGGALVTDYNSADQNGYYLATPTSSNGPPVPGFYVVQTQRFDNFIWQEAKSDVGNYYRYGQQGAVSLWMRQNPPERGSNANGEYVRFSDGTQICFARRTMDSNFQFRSWTSWIFPIAFVGVPIVNHNINLNSLVTAGVGVNDATSLFVPNISDASTSGVLLQMVAGRTLTNWNVVNTYAIAIGRWY